MNYEEARAYMEEVTKAGIVPGLESIKRLLEELSNPQDELKFIHIAGTNGKGSVLSYLSAILQSAGYCVGRYISPTLFHYRERIQVNQIFIEKEEFAFYVEKVARAIQKMKEKGEMIPTAFEIETAISFLYFKDKSCDVVLLETGLGGRYDATNIVKTTILEVFTSISMDHMAILGKTLTEIASQKAGILKSGIPGVSANQKMEVEKVLRKEAKALDCPMTFVENCDITDVSYHLSGQSFSYKGISFFISLLGSYQIENACVAIEATYQLKKLGYEITQEILRKGLKETKWKGRFTCLRKEPLFFIDGAHNEAAAEKLKESMETYFKGKRIFFIMGMLKDKDYEKVAKIMAPLAKKIITITPPNTPRALKATVLKATVEKYNKNVKEVENIKEAVEDSLQWANKDDVIIAFGSLSFLGELSTYVEGMV